MTEPTPMTARVYFGAETTEEQRDALSRGLSELGLDARARLVKTVRSEQLTWLVLVVLPLSGFLGSLGQSLAQDAYGAVKRVVAGALGRSEDASVPEPQRPLLLEDTRSATRIVLEADLPDAAYRQLFQLDLAGSEGRTLTFDRVRNRWH
ncbi:hypothetical protein ABZW18_03805 [Streptomyces sp. NPDC004647]|uniref:hypothetical protein n=1 Tax=Streptomyces sp. NPDC004647 TaxID=3154671 RepID=UPI00339FB503